MEKAPEAFRTITEVSEWLNTPSHVLRFWESRFPEIDPVKRAGGRRYYRPDDMLLLGGIKRLLHVEGNTIKAVQAMIRDKGKAHVSAMSPSLDQPFEDQVDLPDADISAELAQIDIPKTDPAPAPADPAPAQPLLRPRRSEAKTERQSAPQPEPQAEAPSDWIATRPRHVRALGQYSADQLNDIEELYYALKMVRNRMRRRHRKRARL